MTVDTQLTGKAKKAKRDEERRKAGKKRKRHQETQALPDVDNEPEADNEPIAPVAEVTESKSKKRKHEDDKPEPKSAQDGDAVAKPPSKKRRKTKSDKSDDAPKKQRFIVFVGNLPYTITTAGITEHFAKIKPESVRHMTEPGSTKSKGFAFLEFAEYDRMKTCLSLYHHTTIDSGVGGPKGIKKINVELTAGGGGNSGNRKDKLKERNARLTEQRKRKAEADAKAEKRKGGKSAKHAKGDTKLEQSQAIASPKAGGDEEGIHPARLARINAG